MQNRQVRMNGKTNLLELEEHMYPLVDVETPNVFRNLFPYSEVPKVAFNDRIVPHHMPGDIWITDTTFRDGQQSRAPYDYPQIRDLFDYLLSWKDLTGRSANVNSSSTAKRTEMQYTNAWKKAISFRRSQAGSGPARRIFNWSRTLA